MDVRKLAVTGAISVVLHGAALAYVDSIETERPEREETQVAVELLPATPPPVPTEIEVAFLDEIETQKIVHVDVTRARARARGRDTTNAPAISTGGITTGRGTAGEAPKGPGDGAPSTGPGPTQSPLSMRKGKDTEGRGRNPFGLSGRMIEGDPPPSDAIYDPRVAATGELKPSGGGTHKSEHAPFTAHVAADGSVTLRDKSSASAHFSGFPPGIGGTLEVTDWMMRRQGIDPYAANKLRWLDKTRDERVQIGNRHRTQQLARTPEYVKKNLDRLWATVKDPDDRKQALFELWDEADEATTERGDHKRTEAGAAARKMIIGFIRARFPAGSPHAYTRAELVALNAKRQSKAPFAPYD